MKRITSPIALLLFLVLCGASWGKMTKDEPDLSNLSEEQLKGLAEKLAPQLGGLEKINSGDTAWMLVSTGLVLLMVPGLALFYGGMVRRKNVLGTMMHSMVALGIIGLQWVLFGYALAFGSAHADGVSYNGYLGWADAFVGLKKVFRTIPSRGRRSRSTSTACIRACSPSSRRP